MHDQRVCVCARVRARTARMHIQVFASTLAHMCTDSDMPILLYLTVTPLTCMTSSSQTSNIIWYASACHKHKAKEHASCCTMELFLEVASAMQ